MKIYDCFTFFNELDLLELRLSTVYDHVDHIVLVEANTTFTSIPKPFYFEENKDRFAQYLDKIIHVKVEDMPHDPDAWVNDYHQRNSIERGLTDIGDEDIMVVSDLDEIVRPSVYDWLRTSDANKWCFRMPLFNIKLNYMRVNPGRYTEWTMAQRGRELKTVRPNALREQRHFPLPPGCKLIEHAGWHFSFLGDKPRISRKIESYAHQEHNNDFVHNGIDIDWIIAHRTGLIPSEGHQFAIVELNDYFPRSLLDNLDKYREHILDNPDCTAQSLLPPI